MEKRNASKVVKEISTRLQSLGNSTNAKAQEKYMKYVVKCHGLKAKELEAFFKSEVSGQPKHELVPLMLLKSEYQEEKEIGIRLWNLGDDALRSMVFEKGLVTGWASCDSACSRILRSGCKTDPGWRHRVSNWGVGATNLWTVRASCVAFVCTVKDKLCSEAAIHAASQAIRESPFRNERFVQLGVGWLIRDVGQVERDVADNFIAENLALFSAEGLRYAIEKLSPSTRQSWIEQWKQKTPLLRKKRTVEDTE